MRIEMSPLFIHEERDDEIFIQEVKGYENHWANES
jgi:hypothetical protein